MKRGEYAVLDTASFWLVVGGTLFAAKRKTQAAGAALVLMGVGYGGVLWERTTGARFSGLRGAEWERIDPVQVGAHLAALYIGLRMLTRHKR